MCFGVVSLVRPSSSWDEEPFVVGLGTDGMSPLVSFGVPFLERVPLFEREREALRLFAWVSWTSFESLFASLPPTMYVRLSLVVACLLWRRERRAEVRSGNGGISSHTVRRRSSVGRVARVRYSQALCWSSESKVWL